MMSTRRDLYLLMLAYSNHKDHLDTDDLACFLKTEQKVHTGSYSGWHGKVPPPFYPCCTLNGLDAFLHFSQCNGTLEIWVCVTTAAADVWSQIQAEKQINSIQNEKWTESIFGVEFSFDSVL